MQQRHKRPIASSPKENAAAATGVGFSGLTHSRTNGLSIHPSICLSVRLLAYRLSVPSTGDLTEHRWPVVEVAAGPDDG